jgi:hypothetical protein
VTLWRPKRGPVLTWGRGLHLVMGAVVPSVAYWLGGYPALGWACAGTLVAAVGWELLTPALAGPLQWAHDAGDVVDLVAFAAGVVLAGLLLGCH